LETQSFGEAEDSTILTIIRASKLVIFTLAVVQLTAGVSAENVLLIRIDTLEQKAPVIKGADFLRAWAHERMGKSTEAEAHSRLKTAPDPKNNLAKSRFTQVLVKRDKLNEAESEMLELFEQAPEDYKTRNNLVGLFLGTGRYRAALAEKLTTTRERARYESAWQNTGDSPGELRWLLGARRFRAAADAPSRRVRSRRTYGYHILSLPVFLIEQKETRWLM
jgi:predicted Zn-dependent protease